MHSVELKSRGFRVARVDDEAIEFRWTFNRALLLASLALVLLAIFAYGGFRLGVFVALEALVLVPAILVVAGLLWLRPRGWVYLAAAATILFAPVYLILIVTHGRPVVDPLVAGDYFSKVLLLAAAAIAAPAGISGYVRQRKRLPSGEFDDRLRTPHGGYQIAVIAAALGAVLTGALAATNADDDPALAFDLPVTGTREVRASVFAFEPARVELPAGQAIEFVVRNDDIALHTFTYEVGGVVYDHEIAAGQTTRFAVLVPEAGEVPFWCVLHSPKTRDAHMIGMLVAT